MACSTSLPPTPIPSVASSAFLVRPLLTLVRLLRFRRQLPALGHHLRSAFRRHPGLPSLSPGASDEPRLLLSSRRPRTRREGTPHAAGMPVKPRLLLTVSARSAHTLRLNYLPDNLHNRIMRRFCNSVMVGSPRVTSLDTRLQMLGVGSCFRVNGQAPRSRFGQTQRGSVDTRI